MTPLVSVVVPAYNSVNFIEATIRSVLAQSLSDFELVISDHSSSDGTWELLQQFTDDPRVRLSRLPSGGGAPANFNAATALAQGEFVKLVCGDDLLYPDSLAEQVAALMAHPSAVIAASRRDVIDATGKIVLRNRGLGGLHGEVSGAEAIRRTIIAGTNIFGEPAAVLFRRSALVEAGGWDGRVPYLIDQASYCTVLLNGNLIAGSHSLAAFRISQNQWSMKLVREQANQSVEFQRKFAADHPGVIGRQHLLIGAMRARLAAVGRRVVYRWVGKGMQPNRGNAP